MTHTTNPATELDTGQLDQAVGGASIVLHDVRKQEQSDKLTAEQGKKAG